MAYPVLPMALVTFLAEVSAERSQLRRDVRNVTVVAHEGERVRSLRFEIANDDQFAAIVEGAVRLYSETKVDTMTLIFPVDGEDPVDVGIILEGRREPFFFEWTYAPKFSIRLTSEPVKEQLRKAVGVETLQNLLDRDASAPSPKSSAAGQGQRVINFDLGLKPRT